MTRRMIDSAMWQNEKFATLPPMARLLQIGMINHADDQGRGKAHPSLLRAQIFPYDDVTLSDVLDWLRLVEGNGTIMLYSVDGKDYYQMCNWWQYQAHQYAMPSDYPKPQGWSDRIRKTLTKGQIVTCNWILSNGTRSPDTCDEQGRLIQVNNQVNEQVNIQDKDYDQDKDHDQDHKPPTGAGVNGFDGYGSRQQRAAYHTVEAQKLGVEPEAFRVIVDKLIDTAGWRALIDAGQNERKLTTAKDAALELVRMAVTTPAQVDTLIEAYRAVNDWRKTPPTPQALSEYASQIADKLKPKPKKTAWVVDANGNRLQEVTL